MEPTTRVVEQLTKERDTARDERDVLKLKLWEVEGRLRGIREDLGLLEKWTGSTSPGVPLASNKNTRVVPVDDLKRFRDYVHDASLSEHNVGPNGKLYVELLDFHIGKGSSESCWPSLSRALLRDVVEASRQAILSCNSCGAPLKSGEMMVCAVCDKALGTEVTSVEGQPNTFNYEFNTAPRPPPHEYVETVPYKGCGVCGFGPGAYQHNSEAVKRFLEGETVVVDVATTPVTASTRQFGMEQRKLHAEARSPGLVPCGHWYHSSESMLTSCPECESQWGKSLLETVAKVQAKALLEKTRRLRLSGRVDELKAALTDAKRGFELELPGQWPQRFDALLVPDPADPKDWEQRFDFKAKATSPLSWPKGDPKRFLSLTGLDLDKRSTTTVPHGAELAGVNAFEVNKGDLCTKPCEWCEALLKRCQSRGGGAKEPDPFRELSDVLWFLASLTSDHDPGCIVKDGTGSLMGVPCTLGDQPECDCDVTLREGDPWRARVRASLGLPAALKGRLEAVEERLKARRVVQVTPVAGDPGPNGDGTVYEVELPKGVHRLLVLRYEQGSLKLGEMQALGESLRKKLPGLVVLFAQPNWELTVLELP